MTDPSLALRSCTDCQKWMYQDDGNRRERSGVLVEWPKGLGPDCSKCPKCAGIENPTPNDGRKSEPTKRTWMTLARYWEYKVAGGPIDPIQRHNFGILEELHSNVKRSDLQNLVMALKAIL